MQTWSGEAILGNVYHALAVIEDSLLLQNCPQTLVSAIVIATEEIISNVVNYAYGEQGGLIEMDYEVTDSHVYIQVRDRGVPYNPLLNPTPDITLGAEERKIGGLGVFMVKQIMDDVSYLYDDGTNQFTMKKYWSKST